MRRIVRDYVATAIDREKRQFERYIAEHLQIPEPVPFVLTDPVVSIREIRHLKIAPRLRADFPPVDITVATRVSVSAKTRMRGVDVGLRTIAVDVKLEILGTVQGNGYDVGPRRARLVAWWGS